MREAAARGRVRDRNSQQRAGFREFGCIAARAGQRSLRLPVLHLLPFVTLMLHLLTGLLVAAAPAPADKVKVTKYGFPY